MAEVDEEELAYYRNLCERLRACRRANEYDDVRPPVSEEHILAVEAKLGFRLPTLLRMIYLEVADGGMGITDGFGITDDVYHGQELFPSSDLNQDECRKGWRLHPCIERALQRHQLCYVRCDKYPERFLYIGPHSHLGLMLDAETGWIYDTEFEGVLPPRRKGERIDLWSLSFFRGSLWDLCEDWLERAGFGQPYPAFFRTRGIFVGQSHARGELTPELLGSRCTDDPALVWNGLYPGVGPITWSSGYTGMHPNDELALKVANYVPPGGWPEEAEE